MIPPKQIDALARISTILTLDEQMRVDAAGTGLYRARHRREPMEVLTDVRTQVSSLVLLSVQYCEQNRWERVSRMIREIPRIPTVAILSSETPQTLEMVLRLGREGIRKVVDVRSPQGWKQLRTILVDERGDWIECAILERLRQARRSMTQESWTFFEMLVRQSARVGSVRELAEKLEILPSTLMSRFYRAGLPTPKRYLAIARLVRAAYLCENSGFSIANVANHLEYSSPQSFGRHVKSIMGVTGLQFRQDFSGISMLDFFERQLVRPYRTILEWFNPLSGRDSMASRCELPATRR